MAVDTILMSDEPGYVTYGKHGVGQVQAFGNFPSCYEAFYSPRSFHPAARPGVTFTGQQAWCESSMTKAEAGKKGGRSRSERKMAAIKKNTNAGRMPAFALRPAV